MYIIGKFMAKLSYLITFKYQMRANVAWSQFLKYITAMLPIKIFKFTVIENQI